MSTNEQKQNHTPGPWEIARKAAHHNGRLVIESYGFGTIAALSVTGAPHYQDSLGADDEHHAPHQEVMEANARLIAAAPELLEKLVVMTKLYEASLMELDPGYISSVMVDNCRAAIAKATGQEV